MIDKKRDIFHLFAIWDGFIPKDADEIGPVLREIVAVGFGFWRHTLKQFNRERVLAVGNCGKFVWTIAF